MLVFDPIHQGQAPDGPGLSFCERRSRYSQLLLPLKLKSPLFPNLVIAEDASGLPRGTAGGLYLG